MRCSYCETEITQYPANGICPSCGGRLPPRPSGKRCPNCGNDSAGNFCSVCGQDLNTAAAPKPTQPAPVQNIYVSVPQPQPVSPSAGIRCPRCGNDQVVTTNRGFRWGLAILGFFLIPGWGLLFGFIGRKKPCLRCNSCRRKWKPK